MNDLSLKLSAYLDGELGLAEAGATEALLNIDPDVQTQLDALVNAHVAAQEYFEAQLNHPVSFSLVKRIRETPPPLSDVKTPFRPIWGAIAASLVALLIGGAGGYLYNDGTAPIQSKGWLSDIAEYHSVYAGQTRHLVEVSADKADHIEAWLGKTIGERFSIPDLTQFELTFEGGRLLVANGKPVAQLMYRHTDGTVIAVCLQRSNSAGDAQGSFQERTIKGFDFVSWAANGADYVVIGPIGQTNLNAVATRAALTI